MVGDFMTTQTNPIKLHRDGDGELEHDLIGSDIHIVMAIVHNHSSSLHSSCLPDKYRDAADPCGLSSITTREINVRTNTVFTTISL